MRQCGSCEQQNPDDAQFCHRCAQAFPEEPVAPPQSDDVQDDDHLWETFADHRINQTSDQGAGFFRVFLQDVAAELTRLVPDAEIVSPTEAQGFRQAGARKPRRWARG